VLLALALAAGCTGSESASLDGAASDAAAGAEAAPSPTDGGGEGQAADAGARTDQDLCRAVCAKGASLGCVPAVPTDCMAGCLRLIEVCGAVGRAFNECADRTPTASWECAERVGLPTPKPGVCMAEDEAVARCLMSRP
jgi:hypothetical protein